MSNAEIIEEHLNGILVIKPRVFKDNRGYFFESWKEQDYKNLGVPLNLIQDNCSYSANNVLRGLHIQKSQGQILWPTYGKVIQVTVDVRPGSPTLGQHVAIELCHTNPKQVYMPPGFAGGFYVMSDFVCMNYKCSEYYKPSHEGGILWSDPDLDIEWPTKSPDMSDRDKNFPLMKDIDLSQF